MNIDLFCIIEINCKLEKVRVLHIILSSAAQLLNIIMYEQYNNYLSTKLDILLSTILTHLEIFSKFPSTALLFPTRGTIMC